MFHCVYLKLYRVFLCLIEVVSSHSVFILGCIASRCVYLSCIGSLCVYLRLYRVPRCLFEVVSRPSVFNRGCIESLCLF